MTRAWLSRQAEAESSRISRTADLQAGPQAFAKVSSTALAPGFIYETLECHGGNGYVEELPMARLYREAPLNAIWEGSGNVVALDILRVFDRRKEAANVSLPEI